MPSRRQLLAGIGSVAAVGLSGCLGDTTLGDVSPGSDGSTDWPMPRYDSQNTAYSPDAKAPRKGVQERWTFGNGMATGSPVVANGTVFLPTAGTLVALDTTTGEEQWRFTPEEGPWFSAPVVHDGIVYATNRGDDMVFALDATSGEEVWSFPDAGSVRAVHLITGEHVDDPVLYAGARTADCSDSTRSRATSRGVPTCSALSRRSAITSANSTWGPTAVNSTPSRTPWTA